MTQIDKTSRAGAYRIGIYPGTFDPITIGHRDIIARATRMVDHLIIGVAVSSGKGPLFDIKDRVDMVEHDIANNLKYNDPDTSIEVMSFDNLLMHFAEEIQADVIIRGLRAVSDFEYEFQMASMNEKLNSEIAAAYLMASDKYQFIASRFVKEIARMGGDVSRFVSEHVAEKIRVVYADR